MCKDNLSKEKTHWLINLTSSEHNFFKISVIHTDICIYLWMLTIDSIDYVSDNGDLKWYIAPHFQK